MPRSSQVRVEVEFQWMRRESRHVLRKDPMFKSSMGSGNDGLRRSINKLSKAKGRREAAREWKWEERKTTGKIEKDECTARKKGMTAGRESRREEEKEKEGQEKTGEVEVRWWDSSHTTKYYY